MDEGSAGDDDIDPLSAAADEGRLEGVPDRGVLRAVDQLLRDAVAMKAPEIHLDPHPDGLMVRFRGPGRILHEPRVLALPADAVNDRIKILARLDIAEKRKPQDGVFKARIGGVIMRAMVATLPTARGERVVVRPTIERAEPPSLAERGAPPPLIEAVEHALAMGRGLVLAAARGRDRPEALGTLLRHADAGRKLVMIITDQAPVIGDERIVTVTKVGSRASTMLRAAARHCPDVVVLDCSAGAEELDDAVALAREDTVVVCGVPAGSPAEAISYLLASGVGSADLAAILTLAVTEDRFPRLCPECRTRCASGAQHRACGACLDGRKGEAVVYRAVEGDARVRELIGRGRVGDAELRDEEVRCTGSFPERVRALVEAGEVSADDVPEHGS